MSGQAEIPAGARSRHAAALAGLRQADAVKLGRAEVRKRIKAGTLGYLDVIEGTLDHVQPLLVHGKDWTFEWVVAELVKRLRVGYVLQSIPGLGPKAMRELVEEVGADAEDKLGSLPYETRKRLADLVEQLMKHRGLLA